MKQGCNDGTPNLSGIKNRLLFIVPDYRPFMGGKISFDFSILAAVYIRCKHSV